MFSKGNSPLDRFLHSAIEQRTLIFGVLIILALLAFEIFNYSTTDFALSDLLGDLKFGGMRWSTILTLAFCGIDFAGIARLFTPQQGADEPTEVWYLLGAWLIAATMNATLTWWGVSIAILQHQSLGNAVIAREILLKFVPIFVALMVWLSRVLIIGTFSAAGDRFMWRGERPIQSSSRSHSTGSKQVRRTTQPVYRSNPTPNRQPANRPAYSNSFSPAPKPSYEAKSRPESSDASNPRSFD